MTQLGLGSLAHVTTTHLPRTSQRAGTPTRGENTTHICKGPISFLEASSKNKSTAEEIRGEQERDHCPPVQKGCFLPTSHSPAAG